MKINAEYIRTLDPCEDGIVDFETKHPKFNDTIDKLLMLEDISYSNKVWLVTKVVDYKILQIWSVECAEYVIDNYNSVYPEDNRVSNCIEVTKKYLNEEATTEELSAARSAAESARLAAWSAARSAEWSATWSAEWSARSAAESATLSARSAAESATWSATLSAWSAARSVALSAAESAAWSEQEDINLSLLIALIKGESNE